MGKFNEVKESVLALYKTYSKDTNLSFNQIVKKIAVDLEIDYEEYFRIKVTRWLNKEGLRKPKINIEHDDDLENETTTDTNQYLKTNQLSAVKPDGSIMDIATYCQVYGIPIEQVKSFKLVTHSARGAYYNIASANLEEIPTGFDIFSKIEEHVNKYKPKLNKIKPVNNNGKIIVQLIISDTHIGMDTNAGGISLYGGSWSKEDLSERKTVILNEIYSITEPIRDEIDCIQVLQLGDFADGLDGFTVRKGHELPQNMTNEQVFDEGVDFLVEILSQIKLSLNPNKIIWYNVCNSNHSSSFDYFICQAFKAVISTHWSEEEVQIINERKFIGHFNYGKHTEIITHGKDDINLKFGFKAQLDIKGKEKISEYIKFHKLNQTDNFIHFHKGDSHQYVVDRSNPDFDFNSYLALSPSSGWVQTNFSSGRSGFSVVLKNKESYSTIRHDFEFQWGNNNLK